MNSDEHKASQDQFIPTIDLRLAPGAKEAWDRPRTFVYLWSMVELLLVTNPWQVSSKIRVAALRAFGAKIGENVIFRPRTRVKFPWKLCVGDSTWIGEGVWFHNQDYIVVEDNVVISQETLLTTGSHAHRQDMALITRPILIECGAWVTSRCVVLGGAQIGRSAIVAPMTVVSGRVDANTIVETRSASVRGKRFDGPNITQRDAKS